MTSSDPKRGGNHPVYGEYQGGSEIDDHYGQIISGARTFKYPSQLRNLKQLSSNQKTLMDNKKDISMIKFDGVLELSTDNINQLDKEQFIKAVADEVKYYGLQSFFSMPRDNGSMVSLVKESHAFTLEEVIAEYEDRLDEPAPVLGEEDPQL